MVGEEHATWQLKRQAYNRLCSEQVVVPAVLIVLVVPSDMDEWLLQSPNAMLMTGEAYWASIRGEESVDADSKVVHLPRGQVFGVQALLDILERIGNGGLP